MSADVLSLFPRKPVPLNERVQFNTLERLLDESAKLVETGRRLGFDQARRIAMETLRAHGHDRAADLLVYIERPTIEQMRECDLDAVRGGAVMDDRGDHA